MMAMEDMGDQIQLWEQQIQLAESAGLLMSRNASDGPAVKLSQHDCNGKTITQIESDLQGWSLNQLTIINQSKETLLVLLCLTCFVPMVTCSNTFWRVTAVLCWLCQSGLLFMMGVIWDGVIHLLVTKENLCCCWDESRSLFCKMVTIFTRCSKTEVDGISLCMCTWGKAGYLLACLAMQQKACEAEVESCGVFAENCSNDTVSEPKEKRNLLFLDLNRFFGQNNKIPELQAR